MDFDDNYKDELKNKHIEEQLETCEHLTHDDICLIGIEVNPRCIEDYSWRCQYFEIKESTLV